MIKGSRGKSRQHAKTDQMGNISRTMKTLRNNHKEMLEIKNTVIEIKNVFDSLCSGLDRANKRTKEIEDMPVETSQSEIQR